QLTATVAEELRRVVASLLLAQRHEPTEQPAQLVAKQLAAIVGGAQTLEGLAKGGAALAQQVVQSGVVRALQACGLATGGAALGARGGAAGGERSAHRTPQSARVRPRRAAARRRQAGRDGHADLLRPRLLQEAERHARPRRGRRGAATRGANPRGRGARQGSRRPDRR